MADGWGMSAWGGTLSFTGGGGGAGATVVNFNPAPNSPINKGENIEFDIVGATLVALAITVEYPDTGASEVAYDRDGFKVNYLGNGDFLGSERQIISGGLHFILRRRGGWPLSPAIRAHGGTVSGGAITQ